MEAVVVRAGTLWRWKIVDSSGTTFEESTTAYLTREAALDAARQRAQVVMLGCLGERKGIIPNSRPTQPPTGQG
jgi:hypothetical protein